MPTYCNKDSRLSGILFEESENQGDQYPVSNDPVTRTTYQQLNMLQPGQTVQTDNTKTLWLIAGVLAFVWFSKRK